MVDGNQSLLGVPQPGGQVGSGQQGVNRAVGRGPDKRLRAGQLGLQGPAYQAQTQGALSACRLPGTVTNRPAIVP